MIIISLFIQIELKLGRKLAYPQGSHLSGFNS